MKKIMNDPRRYGLEAAEGFIFAHRDVIDMVDGNPFLIVKADIPEDTRAAVIAVCDGGHFPMFHGYVGAGMLDGSAMGEIYQSPAGEDILKVIRHFRSKEGVVLLYDSTFCSQNSLWAAQEAEKENISVYPFDLREDLGAEFGVKMSQPRCGAGMILCSKIAGAAAGAGESSLKILTILDHARKQIASVGLIAECGHDPVTGEQFLTIPECKVQIGGGLHSEAGFEEISVPCADTVADHMFRKKLNPVVNLLAGDTAALLVNGYGGMPQEELYIVFRKLADIMNEQNIHLVNPLVGNCAGNLDTNGLSITIMKLDEILLPLWNPGRNNIV